MDIRHIGRKAVSAENNEETSESSQSRTKQGISSTFLDLIEKAKESVFQSDSYTPAQTDSSTSKTKRLEYLKAIGADSVLTESELEEAAEDEKKGRSLLQLVSSGQLVGASQDSIQNAKEKYLRNATPEALQDAVFDLTAESQGVPAKEAKAAGIKSATELINLKANLDLLGEEDSSAVLKNPETYRLIKDKGIDAVLANSAARSLGLPESAKGLSLKQILDGAAAAQHTDSDAGDPAFWQKVAKNGVASIYKEHESKASQKDKGREAHRTREHTPGDRETHTPGSGTRKSHKPGGSAIAPILHSDRGSHGRSKHVGNSAFNPIPSHSENSSSSQHQQNPSGSSSRTKRTGTSSIESGAHTDTSGRTSHRDDSTGKRVAGNAGQGTESSSGPKGGTNPVGGSANDYGPGEGASQQTGVGASSDTGHEAGSGAVYSVIAHEKDAHGNQSFIWGRSGGGDGQDGLYQTEYTRNADGTYHWTVSRALTGEVVNEGTGDPPDSSIVGTSSQDYDSESGTMTFPTAEEESTTDGTSETDDDDDTDTTTDDGTTEGRVAPGYYRNPNRSTIMQEEWFKHDTPHVTRGQQATDPVDPEMQSHGGRPGGKSGHIDGGGYTDPVDDELQQQRITGPGIAVSRKEMLVNPSGVDSHSPRSGPPEDQPQGPSRAKRTAGKHDTSHRSHQSQRSATHRTRRMGH